MNYKRGLSHCPPEWDPTCDQQQGIAEQPLAGGSDDCFVRESSLGLGGEVWEEVAMPDFSKYRCSLVIK